MQAGSNEILKKMNRKYDLEYFLEKIKKIRNIRSDIAITTDIIVGFPGESDELFNETLEFAKKIKFSKIHVFPYSKREGTLASKMSNQIDEEVKKQRVKKLILLSDALEKEYLDKFLGKELDILIEECDNNVSVGHTSNYLKVSLNETLEVGQIYKRTL